MARTGSFGGFPFDEEVFTQYIQEKQFWKNEIISSGIIQQDQSIMDAIGSQGNVATIPFYTPLNVEDTGMDALNNDGLTNNAPVEISGNKQTVMLIQRMKAFKAKDFTKELTGADPLGFIASSVANYYSQVWEKELMNIAGTVLGLTGLSGHVTDICASGSTVGDGNVVSATTLIDAEQAALGDMANQLGLLVMHSKIFAAYKKLELVDYDVHTVAGALTREVSLPMIGGKHVLVTDLRTVDTTGTLPVYKTFLFGEGAFLSADKTNYEHPYETDYDPETAAGTEKLYTKQGKVLHPNGLSLAVDNIAKESPTFAELGTAANWALKFNHKNVRMGLIKSNG